MAIDAVMSKSIIPQTSTKVAGQSFRDVLQQKFEQKIHNAIPEPSLSLKTAVNEMVHNHEQAQKTIKTYLNKQDTSPEKLLKIQYKTGVFFLREQMFCKTAELSANTFKNFTQMQI